MRKWDGFSKPEKALKDLFFEMVCKLFDKMTKEMSSLELKNIGQTWRI